MERQYFVNQLPFCPFSSLWVFQSCPVWKVLSPPGLWPAPTWWSFSTTAGTTRWPSQLSTAPAPPPSMQCCRLQETQNQQLWSKWAMAESWLSLDSRINLYTIHFHFFFSLATAAVPSWQARASRTTSRRQQFWGLWLGHNTSVSWQSIMGFP